MYWNLLFLKFHVWNGYVNPAVMCFLNNVTTSSDKFVSAFLFQVFLMKFAFLSELLLWNYLEQPIFSKSNGCKKKLKLANQLQTKTER